MEVFAIHRRDNMNNSVRKITDGAMMVALIGLFLFINRQLAGLLDLYAAWLVPLPMVRE